MDEYLIVSRKDIVAIADAVRIKAGITTKMTLPEAIDRIRKELGDSSNNTVYVTFMSHDGTVEYGKRLLVAGSDCDDPIELCLFDSPTREADAQYRYTFSGWTRTMGGDADNGALTDITEDTTVYAAFDEEVNMYTVTFYDEDGETVLLSQTLAYGEMPSYEPAQKGDLMFAGWVPEITSVTGDASYSATWMEKVTFATADWATIAKLSESGKASQYFSYGDTKVIPYNGGEITVFVAGFDHDDLADGSGKAGLTLLTRYQIDAGYYWNDSRCLYSNSYLHNQLNSTVFYYLPEELQNVIKPVTKLQNTYAQSSGTNPTYTTFNSKIWEVAVGEVQNMNYSSTYDSNLGKYYYKSKGYPVGMNYFIQSGYSGYWFRDVRRDGAGKPQYAQYAAGMWNIGTTNLSASVKQRIVFGFCV